FGYEPGSAAHAEQGATDLALFYGRNNLLVNGDVRWVPGSVFATVEEGLEAMARACNDVWRPGFAGERLSFTRAWGQEIAHSTKRATASTRSSEWRGPTICSPTGRPAAVRPTGTLIAGCWVMLNG